MRKNLFVRICIGIFVTLIGLSFSACNDSPHTHMWVYQRGTELVCGQVGYRVYACDCGATRAIELGKTEHQLVTREAQEANCMQPGWEAYTFCVHCGYTTM